MEDLSLGSCTCLVSGGCVGPARTAPQLPVSTAEPQTPGAQDRTGQGDPAEGRGRRDSRPSADGGRGARARAGQAGRAALLTLPPVDTGFPEDLSHEGHRGIQATWDRKGGLMRRPAGRAQKNI